MTTVDDAELPTRENPGPPGTLLFENDRIRVWELIMKPGEVCNWHRHDEDHLLVVVDGAEIGAESADGVVASLDFADHRAVFVPRGHQSEIAWNNSTDRTFRELIIDFKDVDPTIAAERRAKSFGYFQTDTPTTTRAKTGG